MRSSTRVGSTPLSQPQTRTEADVAATEALHPVLRTALASLEIQLESELSRYRRDRVGRAPRPLQKQSSPSLDLIAVSAVGGRTHPQPKPGVAGSDQPLPALTASALSPVFADQLKPSELGTDLAIAVKPLDSDLTVNPGDHAALDSVVSDSHLANLAAGLDDYLESSEELLRSLTAETEAVQVERGFIDSLLTPLGVGSMLLLLVSSAMFGYVVMNPPNLGQLFAARDNSSPVPDSGAIAPNVPQTMLSSPQPNLAAKEFGDLNLDTLGTVQVKPGKIAPAASPSAKATNLATKIGATGVFGIGTTAPAVAAPSAPLPTRSSAAETATPTQQPVRVAEPVVTHRSISTRTSVQTPAPPTSRSASSAAQAAAGYDYKLVTHYDGDRTLDAVRKVVPDAYVRNFPDGARIQLGAYGNAAEAEARVQQLRNQGIDVEVQKR